MSKSICHGSLPLEGSLLLHLYLRFDVFDRRLAIAPSLLQTTSDQWIWILKNCQTSSNLMVCTSACFRRSALVRCSSSTLWTAWPSTDIRTRRALTRACTRTRACMHRRVTAAFFLTCLPRTRAWILTIPFNALKARLAWTQIKVEYNLVSDYAVSSFLFVMNWECTHPCPMMATLSSSTDWTHVSKYTLQTFNLFWNIATTHNICDKDLLSPEL